MKVILHLSKMIFLMFVLINQNVYSHPKNEFKVTVANYVDNKSRQVRLEEYVQWVPPTAENASKTKPSPAILMNSVASFTAVGDEKNSAGGIYIFETDTDSFEEEGHYYVEVYTNQSSNKTFQYQVCLRDRSFKNYRDDKGVPFALDITYKGRGYVSLEQYNSQHRGAYSTYPYRSNCIVETMTEENNREINILSEPNANTREEIEFFLRNPPSGSASTGVNLKSKYSWYRERYSYGFYVTVQVEATHDDPNNIIKNLIITMSDKCNTAYKNVKLKNVYYVKEKDAVFARINGCPYYRYCPASNPKCHMESYQKVGAFSPVMGIGHIPTSINFDLINNFKMENEDEVIKDKNKDIKPVPAFPGFKASQVPDYYKKLRAFFNPNAPQLADAKKYMDFMDVVSKGYCDFIKENRQTDNIGCNYFTYASRPKIVDELRYINRKHLDKYMCGVDMGKVGYFPGILYSICQLKPQYTLDRGRIIKHRMDPSEDEYLRGLFDWPDPNDQNGGS